MQTNIGIEGRYKITKSKACSVCTPIQAVNADHVCAHEVGSVERPIIETAEGKNLIMLGTNTGKSLILGGLASAYSGLPYVGFTGGINYVAIGTSSTAPAISDTQLGSESARSVVSLAAISTNILTIQGFFPDANLTNATYNEIGTFVDATATANSGKIFNHALFGTPYVKSSGEDTTIQLTFTIN